LATTVFLSITNATCGAWRCQKAGMAEKCLFSGRFAHRVFVQNALHLDQLLSTLTKSHHDE